MPPDRTDHSSWPGEASVHEVRAVLTESFGLANAEVKAHPLGMETDNFTVQAGAKRLFVKAYPEATDLGLAERRISLSQTVRSSNIPFPAAYRAQDGSYIARHGKIAISVWEWIDGASLDTPYLPQHAAQVGAVLGRLHAALGTFPVVGFTHHANRWWECGPEEVQRLGRQVLARIDDAAGDDAQHCRRREQVRQRLQLLEELPALQNRLPTPLRMQLVHFDATRANTLWNPRGELVGLVDPSMQVASTTWELGRAAYELLNVSASGDWRKTAVAAVRAYAQHVPGSWRGELAHSARMVLLHNLSTWFDVEILYSERRIPQGIRENLARKWSMRCKAAHRLMAELSSIERELAEAVAM